MVSKTSQNLWDSFARMPIVDYSKDIQPREKALRYTADPHSFRQCLVGQTAEVQVLIPSLQFTTKEGLNVNI